MTEQTLSPKEAQDAVENVSTWLTDSAFLRPTYQVHAAVTPHVPFLFWLTDVLRPQNVVTLGDNNAVAAMAVCQAAKELKLDMQCEVFGTWGKDGGQRPYEQIKAHIASHHDLRCTISSLETLAKALETDVTENAPDLLFVDLEALLEEGDIDINLNPEDLLNKIKEGGALVLHGVNTPLVDEDARAKLIDAIDAHPNFKLPLHKGLVLVVPAPNTNPALAALVKMPADDGKPSGHQLVFERLGDGLNALLSKASVSAEGSDDDLVKNLKRQVSQLNAKLLQSNAQMQIRFDELALLTRQLEKNRTGRKPTKQPIKVDDRTLLRKAASKLYRSTRRIGGIFLRKIGVLPPR